MDCLLQTVGYSIFVVRGELPSCEADQLLQVIVLDAAGDETKTHKGKSTSSSGNTVDQSSADDTFDLELATAISASLEGVTVFVLCSIHVITSTLNIGCLRTCIMCGYLLYMCCVCMCVCVWVFVVCVCLCGCIIFFRDVFCTGSFEHELMFSF